MKTFISYRRDDSQHQAGRLYDRLVREFGSNNVCMDVDSFPVGVDFRDELRKSIRSCDVVLALIGDHWTQSKDADGNLRIHRPDDFVRIEIETALENEILVVPVLVGEKPMPSITEIPDSIRDLAFRNGVVLRPGASFHDDVGRLLAGIVRQRQFASSGPSDPPPREKQPTPKPVYHTRDSQSATLLPAGIALSIILVAGLWFAQAMVPGGLRPYSRKLVVPPSPGSVPSIDPPRHAPIDRITHSLESNLDSSGLPESLASVERVTAAKVPTNKSTAAPKEKKSIRLLSLVCDRPTNLNGKDQLTVHLKVDGTDSKLSPSYPDNHRGIPCKLVEAGQTWDLGLTIEFEDSVTVNLRENSWVTGSADEFVLNHATIQQALPELPGRHYRLRWETID